LADAQIDRRHQRGQALLLGLDVGGARFDPAGRFNRRVNTSRIMA